MTARLLDSPLPRAPSPKAAHREAAEVRASHKVLLWSIHWVLLLFALGSLSSGAGHPADCPIPRGALYGALAAMVACSDLHWSHVVYGGVRHVADAVAASGTVLLHVVYVGCYDNPVHQRAMLALCCLAMLCWFSGWYCHSVARDVNAGLWCHATFRYFGFLALLYPHALQVPEHEIRQLCEGLPVLSLAPSCAVYRGDALAFWLELVLVLTCCYHASILLLHRHYGRRFRQRW